MSIDEIKLRIQLAAIINTRKEFHKLGN